MPKRISGSGLILTLLLLAVPASATDLRGMIQGNHPYSSQSFPVKGATVKLYQQSGRAWRLVDATVSGPDGMYYMRNIAPGRYWLQINGRQNYQVSVGTARSQNIPPIRINY
jgi:hypothetical protein